MSPRARPAPWAVVVAVLPVSVVAALLVWGAATRPPAPSAGAAGQVVAPAPEPSGDAPEPAPTAEAEPAADPAGASTPRSAALRQAVDALLPGFSALEDAEWEADDGVRLVAASFRGPDGGTVSVIRARLTDEGRSSTEAERAGADGVRRERWGPLDVFVTRPALGVQVVALGPRNVMTNVTASSPVPTDSSTPVVLADLPEPLPADRLRQLVETIGATPLG